MADPTVAAPHLARLGATPRPAGSLAAAAARGYCRETLAQYGFVVKEQKFEYSKFTGKWATPLAGVLFPLLGTLLVVTRDWGLNATLACGAALLVVTMFLLVAGSWGVLAFPFMRSEGVNLEALRGAGEPKVWLVAHIDSKSQPVSMITRVMGVVGGTVSLLLVAITMFLWPAATDFWLGVLWASSVPLMLTVVGARNHGSLDNASGVAAVLDAVERLPREASVGVLITDAEELGLAGARAWVEARAHKPAIALNCDSLDDDGSLVAMYSGRPPQAIVSALERAASAEGERVRVIRLIPGILTDHVPLAQAGWSTLTLSRGTVRTLGRIHSSRDTLAYMDGRGIAGAAKVLTRLVTELS